MGSGPCASTNTVKNQCTGTSTGRPPLEAAAGRPQRREIGVTDRDLRPCGPGTPEYLALVALPREPGRAKSISSAPTAGIQPSDAAGFAVSRSDESHVWQLGLALVDQCQREDIVTSRDGAEVPFVALDGEVGDQQHESRVR